MTRIAWFHPFNGVAGDMTLGALVDAGADEADVVTALRALGIDGWSLQMQRVQRCGIGATHAIVELSDHRDHDHDHDHHDHHSHGGEGHEHRRYAHIREVVGAAPLPVAIRDRALATFHSLAVVEAAIHGTTPEDVEFHEVGSLDAIVDIVGSCAALASLGVDEIRCAPITVGTGTVRAAHGVLPNPAPAVVALLAGVGAPARGVDVSMELTTPTGAALMTALASGFGPMPEMTVRSVGYGAGTRDIPGRPNVLQVVIGDSTEGGATRAPGQVAQLIEANVDDVTGEVLAHTIERLLAAGAHDAWITPTTAKKGRPAHTVHALCDPAIAERIAGVMLRETGTLGLRSSPVERWPQRRDELSVTIDGHRIRVKRADGRCKVEHDDARDVALATGATLRDILARAEAAARLLP